jgi:hypothetical protein
MKARAIILGALGALVVQSGVVPPTVEARHDDYRYERDDRHHGYRGGHRRWRNGRRYHSRPYYYYEPNVYYAPPTVYVPPPPPSVGFNLIFPFRIH